MPVRYNGANPGRSRTDEEQYRHFEDDFKRNLIARIDSGGLTKSQASREHHISGSVIDRWQRQIHEGSLRVHPTANEKKLIHELDMYKKKVGELSLPIDLLKNPTRPQRP